LASIRKVGTSYAYTIREKVAVPITSLTRFGNMTKVREKDTQLRKGSEPVPRPDLRWIWLGAGVPGLALWALALVLWAQGGVDEWALLVFDPARVSGASWLGIFLGLTGYGMTAIALLCVFYYLVQTRRPTWDAPKTLYLYVIFSLALSGIVGDLLKMVINRPRPATTFGDQILVLSQATSQALPSGHATKAVALALPVLFFVGRRPAGQGLWRLLVGTLALGVAVSRIVLGAHYVSDVVAGIGMAFVGLPIAIWLAHRVLAKIPSGRLPSMARKWVLVLAGLGVAFLFL
jgi:membrane-associated phospholipid phosphatase